MKYRIRYRSGSADGQHEAMVEANSPAEAVVKFRSIRAVGLPASGACVTSVSADDSEFSLAQGGAS